MRKLNNKQGFTLVEMLIAIAIFAVVATLSSSLFSTFANNQKRTKVSQELLNNAQYALELMSREIKNNEIIGFGADQCKGLAYAKCLFFVRENGETAGFVYDGTALSYVQLDCTHHEDGTYSGCTLANGQAPATMLSADYNKAQILDLDFFLTPDANPYFDTTGVKNQQPRVTIKLSVAYPSTRAIEQVKHQLQTTVPSRVYER